MINEKKNVYYDPHNLLWIGFRLIEITEVIYSTIIKREKYPINNSQLNIYWNIIDKTA